MAATGTIAQATTLVTHTALSAWALANDFLIVIVLAAILFIFAWYVGRGPFVALLLSLYGGYAIYAFFPYFSLLPTEPPLTSALAHIGVYLALSLVFFIILRRVIVSDFLYIGTVGLLILAFLGAAFLIALASHLFAISPLYTFTPAITALFASEQYFFWWFSAPAVGLLFLAR